MVFNYKNKININLKLSHNEIQYLILLPFMSNKKFRLDKIRDVCDLIEEIKNKNLFNDNGYYFPLIFAINQYVSDETERTKLIEVLTMDMPRDEIYEKVMNSGILEYGIEQGRKFGIEQCIEQEIEQGEFNMALKLKEYLGIDEAVRISGFSKEELESGKLIK